MRKMASLLALIFLLHSILSYELEEDKHYFQAYPSEEKDKPYLIHFFNLDSKFYTVNSTEGEDMTIIKTSTKVDEAPIKNLSSIITYGNRLVIKTCFGPDKIVEIIDENNIKYIPNNDYFKKVKNNLENIKYCYSTAIVNPYLVTEHSIVTFWTEVEKKDREEIYTHKSILFFTWNNSFSGIYDLDTKGENYFAHSCTNLRYKYIYCNIDPSLPLSNVHHFSIIPSYIDARNIDVYIRLVTVFARFSNTIYHKPIGIHKYIYSKTGKYADYFLTEYHDSKNNKTRLMTSLYINYDLYTFILRFDELGIYHGINIEDTYIHPNLFNHLFPNKNELMILYIMKGAGGKNLLLLNQYDYEHDLTKKTDFDKYSLSNYAREDICDNPKYMQSMYINSFINYTDKEKEKMVKNKQYYIYQRDIATLISCEDENGGVFYQAKKIKLPQCLNTLNEINGMSNTLYFPEDDQEYKIVLNIENDPNYKSFRNVEIEFFDSNLYNRYIIVQGVKNGDRLIPINKTTTLKNIERLEFARTFNFKRGKSYQLPYRIIQTESTDKSVKCHLSTDFCYFEFSFKNREEQGTTGTTEVTTHTTETDKPKGTDKPKVTETEIPEETDEPKCKGSFCEEWDDDKNICIKCMDIIGIKNKTDGCGCGCDEEKGFEPEPNNTLNMCVCKEGFSFYGDIYTCMNNSELNNGSYCIVGIDEITSSFIYELISDDKPLYYKDGKKFCPNIPMPLDFHPWFKLGDEVIFNFLKVEKCVFIFHERKLVMYSNKTDCHYDDNYGYNLLMENVTNEADYYSLLNRAYEYQENDDNFSFIYTVENMTFFIQNNNTEKNYSTITLSEDCIKSVNELQENVSYFTVVANIKEEGKTSTQVEYLFKYSKANLISDTFYIPLYCQNDKNELGINNTRRRLLSETTEEDKTPLERDEVIVNVKIDWGEKDLENIIELSVNNDINIFFPNDSFYNDVCFRHTTRNDTDIYLSDRRDYYYIDEYICETGYSLERYNNDTQKIMCKGKIKNGTEGAKNVTFSKVPKDGSFDDYYYFPNLKVVKCLFKLDLKLLNPGFFIGLILLLTYIIILFICPNCCRKIELDGNDISINEDNFMEDDIDNDNTNVTKKSKKEDNENIRRIYHYEEPLEELNNKLKKYEDKPGKEKGTKIEDPDPEVYNQLRRPPKDGHISNVREKKGEESKKTSKRLINNKSKKKQIDLTEKKNRREKKY